MDCFQFLGPPGGCPQWLSNLGKAGVPQPVPVVLEVYNGISVPSVCLSITTASHWV